MKFPRSLRIDGYTWKIYHSRKPPKWCGKDGDQGGLCDTGLRKIWVRKTDSPEDDEDKLAHELLHAAIVDKLEEMVVVFLEPILAKMLRDNDFEFMRRRLES